VVLLSIPPWSIIIRGMTREDPQMKLRLPLELKDMLTAAAQANSRSLNAEVVKRLEESVAPGKRAGKAAAIDGTTIQAIADKVVEVLDEREKRKKKT
jgi:hypothetical protein